MHARIAAAPVGATGDSGAAAMHVTRALVAALQALIAQIDVLTDQITEQLHAHSDGHIFRSLPALQLKAWAEGIPTPVYGLQEVHHTG